MNDRRPHTIYVIALALTCAVLSCQAADVCLYAGEKVSVGCDKDGTPLLTFHLGSARLGSLELPLNLVYNPTQETTAQLTKGWSLPILRSVAMAVSDFDNKIFLPDGECVLETRRSTDKSEDSISFTSLDKSTVYKYKKGLLRELINGGEKFQFVYENTDLKRIEDKAGGTILELKRSNDAKAGTKITLVWNGLREARQAEVVYDNVPDSVATALARQGIRPTVTQVRFPDASQITIEPIDAGSNEGFTLNHKPQGSMQFQPSLELLWDEAGALRNVGADTLIYEDLRPRGPNSWPLITLEGPGEPKVLQRGEYRIPGYSLNYSPSERIERYYLETPSGQRLRREVVNGVDAYRAWFGTSGEITRDIRGEFERIKAGDVYIIKKGGVEVSRY